MTTSVAADGQSLREAHWLGEPVVDAHGTYDQVEDLIPIFGRRPFALYTAPPAPDQLPLLVGENPYHDEVFSLSAAGQPEVPVGIVSKSYKLVQHREIFETAVQALHDSDVPLSQVTVYVTLTKFGGRMALRFVLPRKFGFDPGDGHPLHLRLECFNSVDGSSRLVVLLSWYRLVCSNGLILGIDRVHQAVIHTETQEIPDVRALVVEGIAALDRERAFYSRWLKMRITDAALDTWVDGPLKAKWGALAAARVRLIFKTGCDGEFEDPFEKATPSRKRMVERAAVPGAFMTADHAYAASQALAWVARKRLDVQDQLEYMKQIPDLMNALVPS
jgi:hypothetical protein